MKTSLVLLAVAFLFGGHELSAQKHQNAVIDLWMQGKPAFGVFVPNENQVSGARPQAGAPTARSVRGGVEVAGPGAPPRPKPLYTKDGGEKLAMNPLYDYVFLNLEGSYDPSAVQAIAEGLRSPKAAGRKTLIVRIPPFHLDPSAARTRVKEIFDAGGDGVTFPHVQNVDEANQILAVFRDLKINVWSPSNSNGERLAMLMIEDPGALAQAREFADLNGYSILACGIGSLTQAFGGDRAQAEAGTQKILAETKRAKLVNMLTANSQDVETRVKEGFLALLMQGQGADEAIRIGRAAGGR